MMWIFAMLVVLAMGGIALLAAGKGTPMSEAYDDRPDARVPADGPLVGDDLRRVRFSLAVRGYRMSDVDSLLERLADQLDGRPADGDAAADQPADATTEEPAREPAAEAPVRTTPEPPAAR